MQHIDTCPATAADEAPLDQFHALYRGEFAFVWSAARRLGVPPAALDDAVQDVFLTAFRRREQLRFEVSARAWLYGVTRRVASHYHRGVGRRARRDAALAAEPTPPREAPQERLLRGRDLERLLAGLGARTRAAWEMSELLGMSGPEIASELGLPLNTVYSRVRLARQQLQRGLQDPQQLERWLAEQRADDRPPERAAQRGWALLLPALGNPASGGAGLGLLATTRAAVAGTLLLASALVLVAPTRAPAPTPAPTPAPVALAAPPRPPVTTPALAATAPEPTAPAAPDRAPTADPRPDRPARPDRLAEEVALLDRAQALLGAGELAAAQALLTEHARRFADGALVDLRAAAQVQALCRSGDAEEAARAAAQLAAGHPDSAVAQRHRSFDKKSCPH